MMPLPPPGYALVRSLGANPTTESLEVARDGEVFRCKRLSSRALHEDDARVRIVREGNILQALRGRGAPELVEMGEDIRGPFIVMKRIDLPDLDAVIARPERGAAEIARLAHHAMSALADVHRAHDERGRLEVVHADISPGNVLASESTACIVDFGLSYWRDEPYVQNAPFAGTLRYVAPELARGEAIDQRADLFAMAATLLHVASGLSPREAPTRAAMLAHAGEDRMDAYIDRCSQTVSKPLLDRLAPCLAFDKAARPRSADEVFR